MTDEQRTATAAMAKWMGWKRGSWKLMSGEEQAGWKDKRDQPAALDSWNPFDDDLNAVRLIEDEIERRGLWKEYEYHLAYALATRLTEQPPGAWGEWPKFCYARTTAPQRAAACWEVIRPLIKSEKSIPA